eukprot:scaffold10.g2285.t1
MRRAMADARDADVAAARAAIAQLCPRLGPQLLRLAVNDAATWDAASRTGASGTVRTPKALAYAGNEGLEPAVAELEQLRAAVCPALSAADVVHLAGAVAAEALGGPRVPFRPGRRDSKVAPPEARLPTFQSCLSDPARLLAAFGRMGLSKREAVALAGVHPFGRWWSSPATFEQLYASMEVLGAPAGGAAAAASSPDGDSPRASRRGEAPRPVPAFDAGVYAEVLNNQDPLSRHLCGDAECVRAMQDFAADPELWRAAYAIALQKLSEAATGLPPPRLPGAGGAAAWLDLGAWDSGTAAAAALAAAAVVGAGVWWLARRRRLRRGLLR